MSINNLFGFNKNVSDGYNSTISSNKLLSLINLFKYCILYKLSLLYLSKVFGVYAVSFDKQIDLENDSYMYQIFNSDGQYGYAVGGYNSDKTLNPFMAAYSTVDSYLSSLPDDTEPSKSSYNHINDCASLYANNIINFGLCDIDQLNAIQGYQSNVSSGVSNSYIDGTDYSGNSKVVNAIKNACGFNS